LQNVSQETSWSILVLTCEAKVLCFLKIWWRLNEAFWTILKPLPLEWSLH